MFALQCLLVPFSLSTHYLPSNPFSYPTPFKRHSRFRDMPTLFIVEYEPPVDWLEFYVSPSDP